MDTVYAHALLFLGDARRATGDLAQAERCHRQALGLARAIAIPWLEADALAGLGRCALAAGHAPQAAAHLRQALEIFQRIGAAEAANVSRDLAACSLPPWPECLSRGRNATTPGIER